MYDVMTIGTISVDFYFRGDALTLREGRFQLALGGKYDAEYFHQSVGGGAVNVAIGLQKHGLDAAIMGKIGKNEFTHIIHDYLENHSLYHKYTTVVDNYFNISSILLSESGERTVIHHQTPHIHSFDSTQELEPIKNVHAIYIGNIPDSRLYTKEKIIFYAKKHEKPVFINLGMSDCRRSKHQLQDLLTYVDVLIVNGHEFAAMVKTQYNDIDFSENVVKYYIPRLSDKLVIVTEGSHGSYAYLNDIVYHEPVVHPQRIVDTTGAGDGYTAAFIAVYIKTHNIKKAMSAGSSYGAKILSKIGAN